MIYSFLELYYYNLKVHSSERSAVFTGSIIVYHHLEVMTEHARFDLSSQSRNFLKAEESINRRSQPANIGPADSFLFSQMSPIRCSPRLNRASSKPVVHDVSSEEESVFRKSTPCKKGTKLNDEEVIENTPVKMVNSKHSGKLLLAQQTPNRQDFMSPPRTRHRGFLSPTSHAASHLESPELFATPKARASVLKDLSQSPGPRKSTRLALKFDTPVKKSKVNQYSESYLCSLQAKSVSPSKLLTPKKWISVNNMKEIRTPKSTKSIVSSVRKSPRVSVTSPTKFAGTPKRCKSLAGLDFATPRKDFALGCKKDRRLAVTSPDKLSEIPKQSQSLMEPDLNTPQKVSDSAIRKSQRFAASSPGKFTETPKGRKSLTLDFNTLLKDSEYNVGTSSLASPGKFSVPSEQIQESFSLEFCTPKKDSNSRKRFRFSAASPGNVSETSNRSQSISVQLDTPQKDLNSSVSKSSCATTESPRRLQETHKRSQIFGVEFSSPRKEYRYNEYGASNINVSNGREIVPSTPPSKGNYRPENDPLGLYEGLESSSGAKSSSDSNLSSGRNNMLEQSSIRDSVKNLISTLNFSEDEDNSKYESSENSDNVSSSDFSISKEVINNKLHDNLEFNLVNGKPDFTALQTSTTSIVRIVTTPPHEVINQWPRRKPRYDAEIGFRASPLGVDASSDDVLTNSTPPSAQIPVNTKKRKWCEKNNDEVYDSEAKNIRKRLKTQDFEDFENENHEQRGSDFRLPVTSSVSGDVSDKKRRGVTWYESPVDHSPCKAPTGRNQYAVLTPPSIQSVIHLATSPLVANSQQNATPNRILQTPPAGIKLKTVKVNESDNTSKPKSSRKLWRTTTSSAL